MYYIKIQEKHNICIICMFKVDLDVVACRVGSAEVACGALHPGSCKYVPFTQRKSSLALKTLHFTPSQ